MSRAAGTKPCADGLEHRAQGPGFVAAEIIEDDDVSWPQDGKEQLLDIGAEALAVDRTVEDAGRRDPIPAKRAEEGESAPPPLRGEAAQALALRSPAAQGNLRCLVTSTGLVLTDMNQARPCPSTIAGWKRTHPMPP